MLILRSVEEADLPQVVALAGTIDGTMTTLPPQEDFLRDRLAEAVRAFRSEVRKPGGEFYLFVLEDTDRNTIVGTSGIAARVGGFDPFYSYEIRTQRLTHAALAIDKDIQLLHLKELHRGPTELCSLFLRPDSRRGGAGRLLSLGRLLYIAAFPSRFDTTVIAELRGYIDQQGRSPFWEAVGRHFFQNDFYTADRLCGLGNKEFIADLMPRYPLYVPLLPPEVQAVIGRVHHDAEPAFEMLVREGFARVNEVDIFDAGPQLRAATRDIRAIRAAACQTLAAVVTELPRVPREIIGNAAPAFRAVVGVTDTCADGLVLDRDTAAALRVNPGDQIWHEPLKP